MVSLSRRLLKAIRADESAISSVEYAMMIALVGAGIIVATGDLGGAVSNEMTEAAEWFDEGCGNDGHGDGTGGGTGDVGPGKGGEITC